MADLLLDTHSLVFFLERSPELSVRARQAIRTALDAHDRVIVSVVSLVEIVYLAEKRRISTTARDRILDALFNQNTGIDVIGFDPEMLASLQTIPRQQVPDMPDRMISATAAHLAIPLVTRDAAHPQRQHPNDLVIHRNSIAIRREGGCGGGVRR